jgi:hypothetical protein
VRAYYLERHAVNGTRIWKDIRTGPGERLIRRFGMFGIWGDGYPGYSHRGIGHVVAGQDGESLYRQLSMFRPHVVLHSQNANGGGNWRCMLVYCHLGA